ncbi:hypothetical protein LINPERPRIM_LOCUS36394, partial [Linum perenne]
MDFCIRETTSCGYMFETVVLCHPSIFYGVPIGMKQWLNSNRFIQTDFFYGEGIQPKNINRDALVDEGRKGEVFGEYYPISEIC